MSNSPFYDSQQPIKSRAYGPAGRANYDKIFRKGEETKEAMDQCQHCHGQGYIVIREDVENAYGRIIPESYREYCEHCANTGKVRG